MYFAGSNRAEACRLRLLVVGLPILLVGCSSSQDPYVVPLSKSEKNLSSIAMAYQDASTELGRPPKNADEIKRFLKRFGNPDELLISPNDGEPYVVVWGGNPVGGPTDYEGMFPVLAYERKGAGGKRAITDIRGRPLTIPEADMQKLKFVGGHKPSPN